jgi:MYXO-CTERM domain-containing protein
VYSSFGQLFDDTYWRYVNFDGYWEAVGASVTLPDGLLFEDFKLCPNCYSGDIEFQPSEFLDALEEHVIEPFRLMQDLFDDHAYATRLYTTMSAEDMTLDPVFGENDELDDVSNQHTADRIIECKSWLYEGEAPWRIELRQGDVIRGSAEDAASQTWPNLSDHYANLKVSQLSDSGKGAVVVDRSAEVQVSLQQYNDSLDLPGDERPKSSGGCSVDARVPTQPATWALGLVAVVTIAARRRRRAR